MSDAGPWRAAVMDDVPLEGRAGFVCARSLAAKREIFGILRNSPALSLFGPLECGNVSGRGA